MVAMPPTKAYPFSKVALFVAPFALFFGLLLAFVIEL
jgi:hypothetical protein